MEANGRYQLQCENIRPDLLSNGELAAYLVGRMATCLLIGVPGVDADEQRADAIAVKAFGGGDVTDDERRLLIELVSAHLTRLRRQSENDRQIDLRRKNRK